MANTGMTLNHTHDYEDGSGRTEATNGAPLGHSHSLPKSGLWSGSTDNHKHPLPTREPDAAKLAEGMRGVLHKLVDEPVEEKRR